MKFSSWHVCAVICSLLALAACSSSNSESDSEGFSERDFSLIEPGNNAITSPGWLNPKTLQIEVASTKPESDDMVIDGLLVGWKFVATSEIKGAIQAPPVPARCTQVWVVLEDRSVVAQEEGVGPPSRSYMNGSLDPETGLFYPSSSQLVRIEPIVDAPIEPTEGE